MYFISRRNSSTAPNAQSQDMPSAHENSTNESDRKDTRTSMLYNVLPTMVQSRLPQLPSIRQSISSIREMGGRAMHAKSKSVIDTDTESSGRETPPPTYTSRRTSRWGSDANVGSRLSMMSTDTEEMDYRDGRDVRDDVSDRPMSSLSTPPPFAISESMTGINWKYANQGMCPTHPLPSAAN
jgi:hypothetical protein